MQKPGTNPAFLQVSQFVKMILGIYTFDKKLAYSKQV